MSNVTGIIAKLVGNSQNVTFTEVVWLLRFFGYRISNRGRTSGSRICFYKPGAKVIMMHKPHSRKTLLAYQQRQLVDHLRKEHLI